MDVKKLDEAAWDQLVFDWQKSRLTQKDFCEAKKIDFGAFTYRRQKSVIYKKTKTLEKIAAPIASKPSDLLADRFIKILPEIQKQDSRFIELQLPHGIILRIPAHEIS